MEELGVIRKVDEPTEWCHPIVVVMKPNGNIRLCLDLTKLNEGIEREFYQLEGIDETIAKLGEACVICPNWTLILGIGKYHWKKRASY